MADEARTKLASISIGNGREASIWRSSDGTVKWSTGGAPAGATGSDPFIAWAPDGTLACGYLPEGASQVEIRAPVQPQELAIAGGAFVALLPARLDTRDVAALFRDESGAIVPVRARIEGTVLARRSISDTDAMCPACGESDWEALEFANTAKNSLAGEEIVVCRVCGRQEGGRHATGTYRDPAADRHDDFMYPEGLSADSSPADIIASASFSVYALDPETGAVASDELGWSFDDHAVTAIKIEHMLDMTSDVVTIASSARSDAPDLAPLATRVLEGDLLIEALMARDPDASVGAGRLAGAAAQRAAVQAARTADVDVIALPVAGGEVAFAIAQSNEPVRWAAVGRHEGNEIRITGSDTRPEDLRIVVVSEPRAFFGSR
jgi:hypothetical protein